MGKSSRKGVFQVDDRTPDVTPGQWEAADEFRQRTETSSSAFHRNSLGNLDTGQGNGTIWGKGTVVLRGQELAQ